MFSIKNMNPFKIKSKNCDLESNSRISDRTKKFQSTVDSILNRLDTNEHKDKLDELGRLLDSVEKDISTLPNMLAEIDKRFDFFTSLIDKGDVDALLTIEVDKYRFMYGDLIVKTLGVLDEKVVNMVDGKAKEDSTKMLLISFKDYASRFNNKRARLTDEANDEYVKIITKYGEYSVSDMIPKEFKE